MLTERGDDGAIDHTLCHQDGGSAIRIEALEARRQEQQGQALEVLVLGQQRPAC